MTMVYHIDVGSTHWRTCSDIVTVLQRRQHYRTITINRKINHQQTINILNEKNSSPALINDDFPDLTPPTNAKFICQNKKRVRKKPTNFISPQHIT
jgi:hypothetical protein